MALARIFVRRLLPSPSGVTARIYRSLGRDTAPRPYRNVTDIFPSRKDAEPFAGSGPAIQAP